MVYITILPEMQAQHNKLHSPRGWQGHFVGRLGESAYRVYDPARDKVFRASMPRVDPNYEPNNTAPLEAKDNTDAFSGQGNQSKEAPSQNDGQSKEDLDQDEDQLSQHSTD